MHHHRPTGSGRESGFESTGVRHPRGEEPVRVQILLVDRVGVDAGEVQLGGDDISAERTPTHFLPRRPDRDQVLWIPSPDRPRDLMGPCPRISVRRVAEQPERRLIRQVPGKDGGVVPPTPG